MKRLILIALFPLLLAACQSSGGGIPTYGNVSDITNLNGVPTAEAEAALRSRGYDRVSFFEFNSVWWNANTNTCAGIATSGGRVSNVQSIPASSCFR